jgi:1-acyl-sn-glycerol-3-phosphate acyltransferase
MAADAEPSELKWRRRAKTIPAMLAAAAVAVVAAPILVPAVVVVDLVRFRWRLPTLRLYGFVVQYLLNDSAEILAAGPLWVAAGFGTGLNRPASRRRHQRLQVWSIRLLARRADQLLGIRVETTSDLADVLRPAPAVVICRHVSLFDASLPSLLYQQLGYHTRGVIMAELLADPGFDLLYQRAGSVFIPRDNSPDARHQAAAVSEGLDDRTVAVIFPEGRLFRADVLERAMSRLAERDPARAERLAGLTHLLPPRPGGLSALLDAAPEADVVVINHAGLDRYPTFAELAHHVPLTTPLEVTASRIPRADIPDDPVARTEWLDGLWCDLDSWVHERVS